MIRNRELNLEASQWLLQTCGDDVQPKVCYNNVANALFRLGEELRELDWRIGMGCAAPKGSLCFARHAFFVDRKGKTVDPTLLLVRTPEELLGGECLTFQDFSVDEYLRALVEKDNDLSLYRVCAKAERKPTNGRGRTTAY